MKKTVRAIVNSEGALAWEDTPVVAALTKEEIEAVLTGKITPHTHPGGSGQAFPVDSVFLAVVPTDPATLLGYGTWASISTPPGFPAYAWKRTA